MEIGQTVKLKACEHDLFVIRWIYDNDYIEIKSVITGETRPVHISEIEAISIELAY